MTKLYHIHNESGNAAAERKKAVQLKGRMRFSLIELASVGMLLASAAAVPFFAHAQRAAEAPLGASQSPIAVTVPVLAATLSYGDIVDYDPTRGIYELSQRPDDQFVFGVVIQKPAIVFRQQDSGVPVVRSGDVLVNVTLENGPIKAGDEIVASSIAGKGMRASATAVHAIGVAQEAFTGESTTTRTLFLDGRGIAAGTISVQLDALGPGGGAATQLSSACSPAITCVPFGLILRYLSAALVAFGSVYLAFRTFMADAVSGVVSVGRNPRAKAAIQGMVVFNAVLASLIGLAGLLVGMVILFIRI